MEDFGQKGRTLAKKEGSMQKGRIQEDIDLTMNVFKKIFLNYFQCFRNELIGNFYKIPKPNWQLYR